MALSSDSWLPFNACHLERIAVLFGESDSFSPTAHHVPTFFIMFIVIALGLRREGRSS